MKRTLFAAAALAVAFAAPSAAQTGVSVEPYVGYGFFGRLPDNGGELEADVALGGRAAFQVSPQVGLYGNFQRSTPRVSQSLPLGFRAEGGEITVDHWSAGVEFSFPGSGGVGMSPLQLEAGLGQVRYEGGQNDLAANVGVSGALPLSPNLAVRVGAHDFISNLQGERGMVNHVFLKAGVELSF